MTRLGVFLAVAAVAAFFFVNVGVSEAESVGARQMAVVIADRDAVRASEDSGYLFESLFGLLTTLRPEDRMAFVPVQEPEDVVGPVGGAEADLRLMIADIDSIVAGTPLEPASIVDAMVEASSVMGDERALAGSDVYLIVGDDDTVALDKHHSSLAPLLSRFQENGWRVNGLMLPETTNNVKQFLRKMAQDGGGSVYDLSAEGGLTELGQAILSEDLRGSLSPLGQRDLYRSEVMTTAVDVSPGTEETTVIIVKETPDGSLRISNPDGLESSEGDRSRVIETPHVVAWKLTDPAVGSWMVDIDGVEGRVSVWSHSTNRYSLVLGNTEPIPAGQPATISAYIMEDGRPVKLPGITVVARLTTPDGANLAYTMNDDGENGDVVAGDGYYSVALGPLQSIGEYETVLEMWWPDHTYMVSSGSSFTASAFPAIRVEPGKLDELESGVRALVATVYVHVQGEPYAIQSEQLTASIGTPFEQGRRAALGQGKAAQGAEGQSLPTPASAPEGLGLLEVEPQRLFGDGPAWEYQVYYTPSSEGTRDLFFDLDLEYSGVRYAHSSEALRLTSLAPVVPEVAPVAPVVAPVAPVVAETSPPAVPVTVPVTISPKPATVPAETQSVALWPFVLVLVLVVAVIATALAYLLTQARPRGYLYNDLNEPIVDFSKLNRGPAVALFLKNLVPGKDLNVPELSGLVFMFTRSGVKLRSAGEHPTVRVNNQPLINEAEIDDRTWIGSGGKLFTFMLSPAQEPSAMPSPLPMPAES